MYGVCLFDFFFLSPHVQAETVRKLLEKQCTKKKEEEKVEREREREIVSMCLSR